jgi:putative phage-type endonuclease
VIEQGSEEWFTQRLGLVTSSRVADVVSKTKSGPSASRKNYMMQLLCERLTGRRDDGFTSAAMQRGIDLEPVARSAYELERDAMVDQVGFVLHPDHPYTGSSSDGLVGDAGMVEIKCPNTAQHIACIAAGKYDSKYYPQMQHQMWVADRGWCDFVSFDDRLPDALQLFVCRVPRDGKFITGMAADILAFVTELNQLEQSMLNKMERAA